MLSLAPVKYRNISVNDGGPIQKIFFTNVEILPGINGFEAGCFLNEELRVSENNHLYSDIDGMGSDPNKSVAIYKAISESLERWAYCDVKINGNSNSYGFDLDPSTNGMAAFPGFSSRSAREISLLEAFERWSVIEWWSGNLKSFQLNISPLEGIVIPSKKIGCTVLVWDKLNNSEKIAYGFAAGRNPEQALTKAHIELVRNKYILQKYANRPVQIEQLSIQEKRLIWFSEKSGFNYFKEKVAFSLDKAGERQPPELYTDMEIVGPWTRYANVWRCLFPYSFPFENHYDSLDFFMF